MNSTDFTQYVNVFQGNGDYDLPPAEGVAARWFFIKAGTGNTSPAATRPYGRISVGPYTGGYPNGSSSAFPNYLTKPRHFDEGRALLGFSHLHQSGTGSIGCYYNFAVVTPRYADSPARTVPTDVQAEPGYYGCTLGDIRCEVTVTEKAALHRYTFARDGGEVRVDFARYGLRYPGLAPKAAQDLQTEYAAGDTVCANGVYDGLRLYFAVCCSVPFSADADGVVTAALPAGVRTVELAVAISPKDAGKAITSLCDDADFDAAREQSRETWNAALGAIALTDATPAEKREIFYSNLYHTLVKPCDRSDEDFVTGAPGAFSVDYATLWDQYKTQLPLIYLLDRDMSGIIVETLLRLGEKLGFIPKTFCLSDSYLTSNNEARCLGSFALLTAYRFGVPMDEKRLLRVVRDDVLNPANNDVMTGVCKDVSQILDVADCAAYAADLAEECGEPAIAAELRPVAELWRTAFDASIGLLREDSDFYEGTNWNYSFRPLHEMAQRIALAGGEEQFVAYLDRFFGYGAPPVVNPTVPEDGASVEKGIALRRFEGFNNESDMEAPFAYLYAGRPDRTAEIIDAGMRCMFTTGEGGLPGNNDSGGLSSYYVWCALGLFPIPGADYVLLTPPTFDGATVTLATGNTLTVTRKHGDIKCIKWNGKEIAANRLPLRALLQGGTLEFEG